MTPDSATLRSTVRAWGEMIKFSHSVFALPFALIALVMAGRSLPEGHPSAGQVGLIVLCMVAARSFAMTFNRVADAAIDARNPRTAARPLVTGRISRRAACAFLIGSGAVFVAGGAAFRALYANEWPLRLAAPTLTLLAFYSYTKRFTAAAHFVLGAAIGFAPLATWVAVCPATVGPTALLLSLAVMLWIAGFDLIYACQDIAVDRRDGLFSVPARFGPAAALWLSRGCHLATVALLLFVGRMQHAGAIYWAGLGAVALLLAIEQSLVKPDDFSRVNLAFFTVNGVVSLVFAAAAIADQWPA
ncbi:MAG: UbiA-like polyprenyltransferase [Phycisphaerae bacterium]